MDLFGIIAILTVIAFFFLMRAFGAWMFRIDDVVDQLRQVNNKLDKLLKDKKGSE